MPAGRRVTPVAIPASVTASSGNVTTVLNVATTDPISLSLSALTVGVFASQSYIAGFIHAGAMGSMGKPFIVLGDKTSHGGTVIQASTFTDTHNKGIARMGDMVTCPACKGAYPISEGDASVIVDGAAAAYHGCKTACGATLIASQSVSTTNPSGGGSGPSAENAGNDEAGSSNASADPTPTQQGGSIGQGLKAGYEDEPIDEQGQHFRGRFQVVNENDGQPVSGQAVRLRSTGGQYLNGATDAAGYTQWLDREATEFLAMDITEGEQ